MGMGTSYNDRENMRANQKTPGSSVPDGRGSRGEDCGGTPNLRAESQSPATSVPAPASGSNSHRLPFDTFADRTV